MKTNLRILIPVAAAPIVVLLAGVSAFAQCSDRSAQALAQVADPDRRDPHNDRLAQSNPDRRDPHNDRVAQVADPDRRDPHNDRIAQADPDRRDPHNDRLAKNDCK
jgi:hypothetical protein